MPGLDPGIHAVTSQQAEVPVEWIAGSSPAMATTLTYSKGSSDGLERGGWNPSRISRILP
jgi:hypothetical protein